MSIDLLISELTDICVYQSGVIKAQTRALDELGVEVISKEDMEHLNWLCDIVEKMEDVIHCEQESCRKVDSVCSPMDVDRRNVLFYGSCMENTPWKT